MGAGFAKWRAVLHVADTLPSAACVRANAHALARYASLCQEQELVPIVEPEVRVDGSHPIGRCEEVTSVVLHAGFDALFEQCVALEAILLKPNMVVAGKDCVQQASVEQGRRRDVALLAPARACGCARDRLFVGRATRALSDRASQRNKPDSEHEAVEDQFSPTDGRFKIRHSTHGMDATSTLRLANGLFCSPSLLKWSGDPRQIHQRDGSHVGKQR